MTTTINTGAGLSEKCCLIRIRTKKPGITRKASEAARTQAAQAIGSKRNGTVVRLKLYDDEPLLAEGTLIVDRCSVKVREMTLPWIDGGWRLCFRDKVGDIDAIVTEAIAKLAKVNGDVTVNWPRILKRAEELRGPEFKPSQYPTQDQAAKMFSVQHQYVEVQAPEWLREQDPVKYAEAKKHMDQAFDVALDMHVAFVAAELQKHVAKLSDKLKAKADGTAKKVSESAVGNILEVIKQFREFNVNNSDDLDKLIAKTESLVQGVDASIIRGETPEWQTAFAAKLDSLATEIHEQVVDAPLRDLDWD